MKYKVYSYRKMKRILKDNGYRVSRIKGDHITWTNGECSLTINLDPNPMVARRILKTYNLKEA